MASPNQPPPRPNTGTPARAVQGAPVAQRHVPNPLNVAAERLRWAKKNRETDPYAAAEWANHELKKREDSFKVLGASLDEWKGYLKLREQRAKFNADINSGKFFADFGEMAGRKGRRLADSVADNPALAMDLVTPWGGRQAATDPKLKMYRDTFLPARMGRYRDLVLGGKIADYVNQARLDGLSNEAVLGIAKRIVRPPGMGRSAGPDDDTMEEMRVEGKLKRHYRDVRGVAADAWVRQPVPPRYKTRRPIFTGIFGDPQEIQTEYDKTTGQQKAVIPSQEQSWLSKKLGVYEKPSTDAGPGAMGGVPSMVPDAKTLLKVGIGTGELAGSIIRGAAPPMSAMDIRAATEEDPQQRAAMRKLGYGRGFLGHGAEAMRALQKPWDFEAEGTPIAESWPHSLAKFGSTTRELFGTGLPGLLSESQRREWAKMSPGEAGSWASRSLAVWPGCLRQPTRSQRGAWEGLCWRLAEKGQCMPLWPRPLRSP